MSITLHGPWQAWAWYVGGSALFALGVVLIALAVHALADAKRANDALNEQGDLGADWGCEQSHFGGSQ